MSCQKTILLTGATGLLGSEILARILEHPDVQVLVLLRGELPAAQHRFETLLAIHVPANYRDRVELVSGDLEQPGLGLSSHTRADLLERTTHILHAAASIRFDLPYAQAHEINYCGTVRLCELAAAMKQLQAFAHISTAYVAGRRTGLIAEDELDHDAGFVNDYERSKFEGEQFLQARMGALPIAVYRTTTMIGDSTTGIVRQFNYFHTALRALYLGQVPVIPGDPLYRVDVIPHDWAAEVIRFLVLENFHPGETYQVCAGHAHSFSLQELLDTTLAVFAAHSPSTRSWTAPRIVSPDDFQSYVEPQNEKRQGTSNALPFPKQFNHFIAELTLPKLFDSPHLQRDLAHHAIPTPQIRSYYSKMLQYCLAAQWGRRNRERSRALTGSNAML